MLENLECGWLEFSRKWGLIVGDKGCGSALEGKAALMAGCLVCVLSLLVSSFLSICFVVGDVRIALGEIWNGYLVPAVASMLLKRHISCNKGQAFS